LLLLRCDPQMDDFGHVLIVLPIDKRKDWHVAAKSLGDFLQRLVEASGKKYWEPATS
jgi:hypothetical protein